jgi:glucosamine kinase
MSLGLGIDAGGTATRWALADADGRPHAAGLAAPLSGHIFSRAADAGAREIVGEITQAVGPARPEAVVAGVTGLTREAPAVALIRSMLSGALGLSEERVHVAEDMWIAYLSYFAPGEGILVYGGTGSVGYYLGEDRETIRVGGRGNLIDNGGSAFSIARHALRHTLRAEEAPGSGFGLDDPARGGPRAGGGRHRLERGPHLRLRRRPRPQPTERRWRSSPPSSATSRRSPP